MTKRKNSKEVRRPIEWDLKPKDISSGFLLCRDCKQTKPLSDFYQYINKSGNLKFRGHCKPCACSRQKEADIKFVTEHGACRSVKNYVKKFSPEERACFRCGNHFIKTQTSHKYCSEQCKTQANLSSTEKQYARMSGNWHGYFVALMQHPGRKESGLTVEDLKIAYDRQEGKCALSGVEMTCLRKIGITHKTNASIDRIVAGGPYSSDNIQLVCRAVNGFRSNTSIEEYIDWCRKVTEHDRQKKEKT